MIEIKSIYGEVLYVAKNASDVRSAVIEAVANRANLRYADLGYANLRYADLGYANLGYANLGYANLRYADLGYANLRYAKNAELAIAKTRIIPDEGSYIAWKKLTGNCVAKLKIPSKAKRSHASGRKCRASEARVLAIFNIETGAEVPEAYSLRDHTFVYRVGETVKTRKPFSDDMWNECASGIHHFITRAEAENYSG